MWLSILNSSVAVRRMKGLERALCRTSRSERQEVPRGAQSRQLSGCMLGRVQGELVLDTLELNLARLPPNRRLAPWRVVGPHSKLP